MLLTHVRGKKGIQSGSHLLAKGRDFQSLRRVSSAHLAHLMVYGHCVGWNYLAVIAGKGLVS